MARFAKPLFVGSIPTVTSIKIPNQESAKQKAVPEGRPSGTFRYRHPGSLKNPRSLLFFLRIQRRDLQEEHGPPSHKKIDFYGGDGARARPWTKHCFGHGLARRMRDLSARGEPTQGVSVRRTPGGGVTSISTFDIEQ